MAGRWHLRGLPLAMLVYLDIAVVVTWPLALDLDGRFLSAPRRFDCLGTLWLGEHFWRALTWRAPLLHDTAVGWPGGLDLRLADSFLFGLAYVPLRVLLPPVAAFNVFSLLAIAGTGAAGWWLATRVLHAPGAAAWACGGVVAFNSAMQSYRIEGEAYLLGGFLLPALAGWLVIAARTAERRAGVAAGLSFVGLAWSSGYYAVDGALVLVVLGLAFLGGAFGRPGRRHAGALGAFGLTVAIGILPLLVLVGGALGGAIASRFPEGQDPLRNVALDSASLSGLLVPFPGTSHLRQGRIHWLGMAPPVLGVMALVMRRPRHVLPWLGLAAVAVLLALGPFLRLDDTTAGSLDLPYAWLFHLTDKVLAYRMPARFLTVAFVGLGAAAALLIDGLRREGRAGGWSYLLLGLVALDGLVFTGMLTDRTLAPATVPSGYEALSGRGAVLDLWGHDRDLLRQSGLSAFYQTSHGQPVLADFTRAGDAQSIFGRRLGLALANEDFTDAARILRVAADLGVSDIAFHPASFPEVDGQRVRAGLARLAAPAGASDSGERDRVEVFHLDLGYASDNRRETALSTLEGWMEEGI